MNKNTMLKVFLHSLIAIILLPSCVGVHYEKKRFILPRNNERTIRKTVDFVDFTLHQFSIKECEEIFGKNLILEGYYPFHLTIENKSSEPLIIEPNYISLPLTPPHRIAKLLHYNTSLHMTYANTLALLFLWPLIPIVIGPTGYSMYKYNHKVNKLLKTESIGPRDRIKIARYGKVEKYLFIRREDYSPNFSIKCYAKDDASTLIALNVDLRSLQY